MGGVPPDLKADEIDSTIIIISKIPFLVDLLAVLLDHIVTDHKRQQQLSPYVQRKCKSKRLTLVEEGVCFSSGEHVSRASNITLVTNTKAILHKIRHWLRMEYTLEEMLPTNNTF